MTSHTPHRILIGDSAAVLPTLAAELPSGVDAVYLDPPYDHGDGGRRANGRRFAYTDRRMADWGGYIRDRLTMLRPLLAAHAPVAVSIGHQRLVELATIMAEVFEGWDTVIITVDIRRGMADRVGVIRSAEYLLIAVPPGVRLGAPGLTKGEIRNGWGGFGQSGFTASDYPNQHYGILVEPDTGRIIGATRSAKQLADAGEAADTVPDGAIAIWPITKDGKPIVWRAARETFTTLWAAGHIRADKPHMPGNPQPFVVKFLSAGTRKRIATGELATHGQDERGAIIVDGKVSPVGAGVPAVWSGEGLETRAGTERLEVLLGHEVAFGYPKPVRLVADAIRVMTGGRRDAVVLDCFAGSGTTLDAIVHLNTEDGGIRRAVLVQLDEAHIVEDVLLPRVRAVIAESGRDEQVVITR